jgi:pimeloyl-ACP methyl ester carboxylesterase
MFNYLLIFLINLLIFYSCGGNSTIQYPEPPSNAREGSFSSRKGVYQFGGKEYNADYGIITVPENRKNSNSRLIHLPVMRIHARNANVREPVFGLAGGPGMSNMIFRPIDSLLYDHDFVIVGYRGVDGSTILGCPDVSKAFKNGEDDLLSEQSLREIGEGWTKSIDRFKSLGIDLNGYTIPETIEDLEAVRKALNYNQINLLSESYGTRVAYIYGVMHPETIHRSVMIAFNPPGGFFYDPQITDNQIRYYSRLWAKDSVLEKLCPDLAATMQKVLRNMPEKWFLFSINPGKVKVITFALLFQRNTAAMVFDTFIAAEKGDYSGLALMSIAFDYMFPDMFVWGDLAAKAVSADFDSVKIFSIGKRKDELLGAPMNKLLWEPLKYSRFPIEMIEDSLRVPEVSAVETLILSGSIDFSTPAECGKEFLQYLTNGRQVIISEAGHVGDIRYLQLNATKALISDYINKGIVNTSEVKYIPMNFNVKQGFPAIAKAALGIIGMIVLLLAACVVWIF